MRYNECMKKGGYLRRKTLFKSRHKTLRVKGVSTASQLKEEIQALLRAIAIKRDRGCILRMERDCGGEIGQAVLQADHLISRSNSATFADERLVVCLCKSCHG